MSTFGERLREERNRIGLSQTAFAKAANIHLNTQSRYEKGDRTPDTAYLEAISQLGVDAIYVLTGMPRGFSQEEAARPGVAELIDMNSYFSQDSFNCDFFLSVLGITPEDWKEVVRLNLSRWPEFGDIPGVMAYPFSSWGPEIARVSSVISGLLESASRLDSALLAKILEGVDEALAAHGQAMEPPKKAQAVAMLYRAFKASGKVDPAMIEEAVKLAAG